MNCKLICEVKRGKLEFLLRAASATFPDEFIALLEGKVGKEKVLIDSIVVPPFSEFGEDSSSFSDWFLPPMPRFIGVFHSHPNGVNLPSSADLALFRKGQAHLIASSPFTFKNCAAFNNKGKRIKLVIT